MSLQVWLPLNGSLENLGLGDVIVTNDGATVESAGKIGNCYSFDGNDDFISISSPVLPFIFQGDFSIAMWVYNNDVGGRAIFIGNFGLTGAFFSFEKLADEQIRFWWNGHPDIKTGILLPTLMWSHLVCTKRDNTVTTYLNGQSVNTYTGTFTGTIPDNATLWYLGRDGRSGTTALNGRLNDFRIYDHCLSQKEVKELSKGLVAHYPLNDFVGNPNLLPMDHGVNNVNTRTNYYLGGTSNSIYHQLDAGTYTISVSFQNREAYPNVYYLKRNGSNVNLGRSRTSKTFELTESGEYRFWLYANPNDMPGIEDDQVVNFKLEKGSVATPWIPNIQDDLYSAIGLDEGIIYDCSGYGHHGTLSPTPPVVDSDSIRYSSCMKFNGSNNYVDLGIDTWCPTDQITVSMWVYRDVWQSANSKPISCTESGGFNFEEGSGGGYRFPVYKSGTGYMYGTPVKKWADYTPGWHFIVGTFDGYVSKIYIDGEHDCGSANSDTKALIRYNVNAKLFIGCEAATANPSNPYLDGKLSDVRIYATALSAEDVKELYETSASIDNKGNFHAYEISEV